MEMKEGNHLLRKRQLLLVLVTMILSACNYGEQKQQASPVKTDQKKVEQEAKTDVAKKGTTNEIKHPNQGIFPQIDHIVIVVEENHSSSQIINNASAPYINHLMKQGANFTNLFALDHPSQPNYLNLFSGSNHGVTDDEIPNAKFSSENLASELIKKHYSFAGFSEDQPSEGFNGEFSDQGYARKHNPWVNFTNVPKESNQPLRNFPKNFNQLPNVCFIIPTEQNDMHDGSINKADQWLKAHVADYLKWAEKHNSLLIVTWDEDDDNQNNKIPTFFVGPMVKAGQFREKLNHINLLRTVEDIYGLSHAGAAKTSKPIKDIWK